MQNRSFITKFISTVSISIVLSASLLHATTSITNTDIANWLDNGEFKPKNPSNNDISMNISEINGRVYGGYSQTDEVKENKLNIEGGIFNKYIYGGYSKNKAANSNKLIIKNTIKTSNILGAESKENASNNEVHLINNVVTGTIFGAKSESGEVNKNKVIISGGEISSVSGGKGNAKASENSVTITSTTINSGGITGGHADKGESFNNTVEIINSTSTKESSKSGITGGRSYNKCDSYKNIVVISNTNIQSKEIEGGRSQDGDAYNNKIKIFGKTFINHIGDMQGGRSKNGNAYNNAVTIENATIENRSIYGGYSSNGKANHNAVTIENATIENRSIYGGYSSNGKASGNTIIIDGGKINSQIIGSRAFLDATNNTITIKNSITIKNTDLTGSSLIGGMSFGNQNAISGNTLNLYAKDLSVVSIRNFENIYFYIPKGIKASDTVLSVSDTTETNLENAKIGAAVLDSKFKLKPQERVTLIKTAGKLIKPQNLDNHINAMIGVSAFKKYDIYADENSLYLYQPKDTKPTINPAIKSFFQSSLASTAFINYGGDLINDMINSNEIKANNIFGIISGVNVKHKTGSHIDAQGVSFVTGVSKTIDSLSYGLFFEAGRGSYDSFENNVFGNGENKYYGGGVLFDLELGNDFYLDGSLRAGKVQLDYKSDDFMGRAEFKLKRNYIGGHIGGGKVFLLNSLSSVDVYTRVLYSRIFSKNQNIRGDEFYFDDINSIRLKTGIRYTYKTDENINIYGGAAYEYEFSANAKGASLGYDYSVDEASLKGASAMFELGSNIFNQNGFDININLKSYIGQKTGVSGGLKVEYKF
ncbi:autotransporter outer membrane beta-barrel domain-containing protein [Campylobacter geochelonis]|uniref:autotransporter outer membrane beta-barrel domain-containing protein n=1 Tax=Campylobacter geochelonis TaxID=1780362 RepID=UPI0007709861|nr:autotransporter outer membrane beta-barrel domain-containing protein [Campylobacter geochelonis]CZE48801.1 putative high-molecular-weight surface-exposed protein [Campylobacter geochelonis]